MSHQNDHLPGLENSAIRIGIISYHNNRRLDLIEISTVCIGHLLWVFARCGRVLCDVKGCDRNCPKMHWYSSFSSIKQSFKQLKLEICCHLTAKSHTTWLLRLTIRF